MGTPPPHPLENHVVICFLRNIGTDILEKQLAIEPDSRVISVRPFCEIR